MVYISVAIPLFLFSLATTLSRSLTKNSKLFGFFFILLLTIIASIRYKTGTDYDTYTAVWNGIKPINEVINGNSTGYLYLEPGFRYFVSILKMFGDSPILFFSLMAILTLGILYLGLSKFDNINIYVAISIYFMVFYMPYAFNGMRQALAMSIFIYSLPYIHNRDLKKTILLSLLAASFHSSGFLIIVAYMAAQIKMDILSYYIIGSVTAFLFYYFGILGKILDLLTNSKFSMYAALWGKMSAFHLFNRVFLSLFFVYISLKIIKTDFFKELVKIYLLGFFIYIALADAKMLATRFNMFFRVLEVVMCSMILYQSKYVKNRIIFFIFIFTFATTIFYLNISNEDNIYKTIFN